MIKVKIDFFPFDEGKKEQIVVNDNIFLCDAVLSPIFDGRYQARVDGLYMIAGDIDAARGLAVQAIRDRFESSPPKPDSATPIYS